MTPARKQRLAVVLLVVFGVGLATLLALRAFEGNILFFFSPSQVAAGEAPLDRRFRIGGLVEEGSIHRNAGELAVRFTVTDTARSVTVLYDGLLPNLFREGQGVVAHGRLNDDGVFVADEVLARHDENYMPPEVHEALKRGAESPVGKHYEEQP
ncbi:MAG: cytochrome c maturation protein CcmE [Xanthomonadaceae bacterium]|nr:cytochrome c maturation protein CcmE [Xanthomonadaceae bacterium]